MLPSHWEDFFVDRLKISVFSILYTSSEELPFKPFRLDDINPKFRLLL